jgi:activating signal cointegrator complex subunit 3
MIRYHEPTGTLHSTDLGRTASHFYIKHVTIEVSLPVTPTCK